MDYRQLIDLLFENSNSKYDEFNKKIVNSSVKTIGCTVPFLRKVAKKHFYEPQVALQLPVHQYFEVDLLRGIVLSTAKIPFEKKQMLLWQFAQTIENWAVCDCCSVKFPSCEADCYFELFCQMCTAQQPFVCRYGLVNLLTNFLDDEHIGRIFNVLSDVCTGGHYYVDMAEAWLVATAMVKCRCQTVEFLKGASQDVLTVFAYNTALQKIRDSLRVSDEDKRWTKLLKR